MKDVTVNQSWYRYGKCSITDEGCVGGIGADVVRNIVCHNIQCSKSNHLHISRDSKVTNGHHQYLKGGTVTYR